MDILQILSNMADGVFAVNDNQKIIFWNEGARSILGYAPEEVLGKDCCDVIAGSDESGEALCSKNCSILNFIQNGDKLKDFDMLTRHKTGTPVWLNISNVTVPGNQKTTVVHIFRDITGKKQNEELIKELISIAYEANPDERNDLPAKAARPKRQSEHGLTRRELEVLELLTEGKNADAIAEELYISLTTARKHIQNIIMKLGFNSKLEAVIYALKNNLV